MTNTVGILSLNTYIVKLQIFCKAHTPHHYTPLVEYMKFRHFDSEALGEFCCLLCLCPFHFEYDNLISFLPFCVG